MYKVTEIIKETDVEGKFGMQKRTAFKVEGNPNVLSGFSKYGLKVGQEIDGTIEQSGQWWNFKFASKAAPARNPDLERRLGIACDDISAIRKNLMELGRALLDAGVIKRPASQAFGQPYPERDSTNDMHPLEEQPF